MLHSLLQSGMLRLFALNLKDLSLALLSGKGKAEKLRASYRREHAAMAVSAVLQWVQQGGECGMAEELRARAAGAIIQP